MRRSWVGVLGTIVLVACRGGGTSAPPTEPDATTPAAAPADAEPPDGTAASELASAEGPSPAPDTDEASSAPSSAPDGASDPGSPPRPRPTDRYAKPSEAEFRAWDRKDPRGDERLYKWDKANLERMLGYFEDIQCFRHEMKAAGEQFLADPRREDRWTDFKREKILGMDRWQKEFFAKEPRVLEHSKFVGRFLEALELVMHGYPSAYNDRDRLRLDKADALWAIVEAKVDKYTRALGGELKPLSAAQCSDRASK